MRIPCCFVMGNAFRSQTGDGVVRRHRRPENVPLPAGARFYARTAPMGHSAYPAWRTPVRSVPLHSGDGGSIDACQRTSRGPRWLGTLRPSDGPATGNRMTPSDVEIETAANALHHAAVSATPSWIRSAVLGVVAAQQLDLPDDAESLVADAGQRGATFVDRRMAALLHTDIDRQTTTPLSIFRDAVRFPVEVLHRLGAHQVHRIDVSRWAFPNDPFDITPATLSDIDADLQAAGIVWGATKAGLHLQRRRDERESGA